MITIYPKEYNHFNEINMETVNNNSETRIMIAERSEEIKRKKSDIAALLPYLNQLAELYKELNLGTFTADDLQDAINNDARCIKQRYSEFIKEAANDARLPSFRNEAAKEAEFNNAFSRRLQDLQRIFTPNDKALIKYMTVNLSGVVEFSEDSEKELEEDTHVYLTNPDEIAKYKTHCEIIRLLNDFFGNGITLMPLWWNMFPIWNGVFQMPENGANYAIMVEREAGIQEAKEPQSINKEINGETSVREKKQQNRQRGGMVTGIGKKPDYVSHTGRNQSGEDDRHT